MRTIRTIENETAFLEALAATCNVTKSCGLARIGRVSVYAWRDDDPAFAAKWEEALRMGADALEDEARRRAVDGIEESVFHGGKQVGTVRKFSDTLLIFLLKGAKPEKYKDRVQSEISGPGGGPIKIDDATATQKLNMLIGRLATRLDIGEDLV